MLFDVCSMIVQHRFIDLVSLFMLSCTRGRDFLPTRAEALKVGNIFNIWKVWIELIEQQLLFNCNCAIEPSEL